MRYLCLSLAALCNVSAYILFKCISGRQTGFFWFSLFFAGLVLGATNTWLFTRSLKEINLGIAYPVFSAASVCLVVLVSVLIFKEKIGLINIMGAGVAVFGIGLLVK